MEQDCHPKQNTQRASGQGSHLLIESPTNFCSKVDLRLSSHIKNVGMWYLFILTIISYTFSK